MVFIISFLRALYDDKEPRRVRQLLEATLGACIVFAIGQTCLAFDISTGYAFVASGAIGTFGVDQVREIAKKWANGRVK